MRLAGFCAENTLMAHEQSPAFQFYPSDYLASMRVQLMGLAEEGAYLRCLCYCWLHGSIPANPADLVKLIGKGGSLPIAESVASMFSPHPEDPSRLVHDRLESERAKQAEWRRKSAQGGKNSGIARKTAKLPAKGGSTTLPTVVEPPYEPKGNSSVFSLQSSINTCESLSADADAVALSTNQTKSRKPAQGAHPELVRLFCDGWQARYGVPFKFTGKDGKHIKWILDAVLQDQAEATKIVNAYLADDDNWLIDKKHPLGQLVNSFNKYRVEIVRGKGVSSVRPKTAERGEFAQEVSVRRLNRGRGEGATAGGGQGQAYPVGAGQQTTFETAGPTTANSNGGKDAA
jgi:hypothetical protein